MNYPVNLSVVETCGAAAALVFQILEYDFYDTKNPALCFVAAGNKRWMRVSAVRLAQGTGLSERVCKRCVEKMKASGWIQVKQISGQDGIFTSFPDNDGHIEGAEFLSVPPELARPLTPEIVSYLERRDAHVHMLLGKRVCGSLLINHVTKEEWRKLQDAGFDRLADWYFRRVHTPSELAAMEDAVFQKIKIISLGKGLDAAIASHRQPGNRLLEQYGSRAELKKQCELDTTAQNADDSTEEPQGSEHIENMNEQVKRAA